jgi:hypothetical protein
MRRLGNQAEDILNNTIRKEDGNFVWMHFRMEIIDMTNKTNELKNTGIQIDYNTKDISIMQHFLPPQPHEILIPDFSVKPADDVDLNLQISSEQSFTTNSANPKKKMFQLPILKKKKLILNLRMI